MTTVVDLLILLAAVIGSSSMVGLGMWWFQRLRRLEEKTKDLGTLLEHVAILRDQVGELYERVDFTERMLTREPENKRELPRG